VSVDGTRPITPATPPDQPAPAERPTADPAAFHRLLEEIESGAYQPTLDPDAGGLEALDRALDRADADYRAVMDLGRLLEDAWRRRQ